MKNVLFVSIAFPPKQDPECLQVAKYFKYLAQDKELSYTIITSAIPTLNMPYDPSLEKYNKGYLQKIELKIPENKYLIFLLRKFFPAMVKAPDSKIIFASKATKVLKQLTVQPDLIYSRSSPMSSALLALKLKEKLGKPWVMHLSDPWADSLFYNHSKKIYKKNKRLEATCFKKADKICFTSEMTLDFYSRQYPAHANKFEVFPNVFDLDDLMKGENGVKAGNKLKIVHTGGLTVNRSPAYLLEALDDLKAKGFDIDNRLEIIFAGDADRTIRSLFAKNKSNSVEYVGRVSYENSKKLQQEAHLLICIEDPVEVQEMAMFFPSKILDYIVAGKKFFALTTAGSQLSKIFEQYNWPYFVHNDRERISEFLLNAFSELQSGNKQFFQIDQIPQQFSAAYNAQRLIRLFKQLCETSS